MSQNVNYIPYYHLVTKAKIAKCQQNYDSAIACYSKAFTMVDYILTDDLRSFTQCAIAINNDSLVYFAMEQCNKQTIPIAFIVSSVSVYEKYKNTEQWNTCMAYERQNWGMYTMYSQNYSNPAQKILDSLVVSDQAIRNKWNWFSKIFCKSKLSKKSRIIDSCNQRALDEMIQKYGFPNERTGFPNNYAFIHGGSGIVLVHYDDTNFFHNVEYKALLEGKLSPDCYANRAQRMAGIYKWDKLQYTYYYSKRMTPQEKAQVDRNRYEIGLPSVKEEEIIRQCNNQEYQKRKAKVEQKK